MATAMNIKTGHLRNDPPDLFCGDCSKLDQFKKEFKLWRGLNVNHKIMRSPYLCTMLILSLIKEPLVNDWTNDQIDQLEEKVTCTVNPISQDQEVLWNEFVAELDSHFADTMRKQKAYAALQDLCMRCHCRYRWDTRMFTWYCWSWLNSCKDHYCVLELGCGTGRIDSLASCFWACVPRHIYHLE
jgi:hypothetical protein